MIQHQTRSLALRGNAVPDAPRLPEFAGGKRQRDRSISESRGQPERARRRSYGEPWERVELQNLEGFSQ